MKLLFLSIIIILAFLYLSAVIVTVATDPEVTRERYDKTRNR
jgi:uncharacterized BrkB/YihY/UPF0761 family membrane protein